jgi:pimeloyl-ACP methyl ester carboxylesterase
VAEVGYFRSGDDELAYSCVVPRAQTKSVGIIFVHALDGNRLGPHRMFVELAERFNRLGYPTLRFDLTGSGDSAGSIERNSITAEVNDVVAATRFFINRANLEAVILLGISRGARVCYSAMADYPLPLRGAVLLSTPLSSSKAAAKALKARLTEYACKLKDPGHLWKLVSGNAHPRQIWQTLVTAVKLRRRYEPVEQKPFASACPVLLIYGQCDPNAEESCLYYTAGCRENDIPHECHFIQQANHSFFHYKWKQEILDISANWLEKICERQLV